jgi:hypothetical protein
MQKQFYGKVSLLLVLSGQLICSSQESTAPLVWSANCLAGLVLLSRELKVLTRVRQLWALLHFALSATSMIVLRQYG